MKTPPVFYSHFIILFQIFCHGVLLVSFVSLPFRYWIPALAMYCFINGLGIVCGYHRLISHKSYKTKWKNVLSVIGCMAVQGSPLVWAGLHRAHHAYSDTDKDPHTPSKHWWKALMSPVNKIELKFVKDLVRDKFQQILHRYYMWGFVGYYLALFWFLSIEMFIAVGLIPVSLTWIAVHSVNLFCHFKSLQNISIISWLSFGEGYHSNHHANPGRHRFGDIDLGATVIEKYLT